VLGAWDLLETAVGPLIAVVDEHNRLVRVWFGSERSALEARAADRDAGKCAQATGQLREYFARRRRAFDLELG
jgi:hypothetical protein